jgi:hypothetical protein
VMQGRMLAIRDGQVLYSDGRFHPPTPASAHHTPSQNSRQTGSTSISRNHAERASMLLRFLLTRDKLVGILALHSQHGFKDIDRLAANGQHPAEIAFSCNAKRIATKLQTEDYSAT